MLFEKHRFVLNVRHSGKGDYNDPRLGNWTIVVLKGKPEPKFDLIQGNQSKKNGLKLQILKTLGFKRNGSIVM